ncbi:cytochrome P450/oxidoreductase [Jhaorihella thermophila]|uniref:Cytochrome P450 n=2 Tax=Jhaorihella thermophila TaxID=488547 RepID=A0A1H5TZK0_9RHOB|nr:cytochrome P450/oxidoreductase [Jhaorihella thermophila]SEF68245.1 Cytochrome P450 [Jhaorihella thermophila]
MATSSTAPCPHGVAPNGCPISADAAAFRPFDGPYQLDPAEALRRAREREPVFYAPDIGYWVVTRYEDVKAVFRDNNLFSPAIALEKMTPPTAEAQAILRKYNYNLQRTMVNEDEPQHMERRRLLLDDFLPERLARHEPMVRRLCRDYMDRFIDRGHADLVNDIFYEIPLTVALHFLGVPDEGAERLRQFAVAHTLNTWGRPPPEEQIEIAENVGRFWQTANEILDDMIANPDGEGWMYETVRQHFKHPDIVPESYMRSMMMAILAAAHETTSNATANAFWTLLTHRDAWEEICENPALIPSAVEECLRVAGSIIAWRRIATDDAELGGVKIPKGGKLLIVQASANRDAAHWENPDQVDIYRDNAVEHLTFGYGAHQCMGKNIGRMEMRVFLEEFTRRLPHMRLVPGQTFENLRNISFRGPARLLVEWDPAQNPERHDPSILDRAMSFPIGAPVRDDTLRRVVVQEVRDEATGVRSYRLADPRGKALPKWTPGSHVDLVAGGFRRKYSLCGDAQDSSTYQIAILREEDGRGGSRHFHDTLEAGATVHIAGPRNHFRLDEGAESYVLVAGGIGITPILAMADRLRTLGRPYRLHYCGATRAAMALLERVMRDHGDRLRLHVSDEGTRLDMAAELTGVGAGTQVYACGPERMLEALQDLARGWPEGTLHYEYFSAGASGLDPSREHGFEVVLADSDMTIQVAPDETVFEALRRAGVDLQTDCGEGLCGTCEARVLEGEIDHRDRVLSRAERDRGDRMMTCCSRARGRRLVLAL